MILAIDMGNSNIVIGGIDENKIYFLERLTTNKGKTDLEYAINIKNILELNNIPLSNIEGAILSSVVPPLNSIISSAIKKVTSLNTLIVNYKMNFDLKLVTDNPASIGADLIVDSIAAINEYPLPLAVIDLGTATTIFLVDENKNFIGGIIHPGLKVALDSLSSKTAQLPFIDLKKPKNIIGKNTIDSMRSGILYGHAGAIDGILNSMEKELSKKLNIIATGGIAPFVIPLCEHKIIIDDNLLLKGLLKLYRDNTSH